MSRSSITMLAALAGLAIAAPAAAQDQTPAAQTETAPDPARLAAAMKTIDYIFPAGTYAKMMMGGTFKGMMSQMVDSMTGVPLAGLAKSFGLKEEELKTLDNTTISDVMQIMDPAYKQRMNAVMDAMMPMLSDMISGMEPSIREGLAHAYAKHFTLAQLNDLNQFFATPSGNEYASNAVMLQMDPEVIARQTKDMPQFMEQFIAQMPDIVKKMEAATADLPKARDYKDLTAEEKIKLVKLLGIDEEDLGAKSNETS